MVTITILSNTRGLIDVDALPTKTAKALDDHFAFRKSKFWWKSRAAKTGRWDGYTRLLDHHSGGFPLGLIVSVKKWFKQKGIAFKVVDERPAPSVVPSMEDVGPLGDITLYPYQQEAVEKVLRRERGIIHGATGSGKTEMAAAIIKAFGMPKTLFMTGRKKLARQTRERFALRLGVAVEDIGLIQGGKWIEGSTGIYVAVLDTLTQKKWAKQRGKLYKTCDLLFIDEAHHAGSTTWYRTLGYCRARYRYGLTGTPVGRSDSGDLYLRACTGGVIARVTAKSLVAEGVLATPAIYFTEVRRPKIVEAGSEWSTIYKKGIVDNVPRNRIIVSYAQQLQAEQRPTLILVKEIDHGLLLEHDIEDSVFLHGSCEDDFVDQTVKEFERGEVSTLIATSIFDEGVDIPVIEALILASGGKSVITTLQRIGRGLRRKERDNRLFVFDFVDATSEYLLDHSERRVATCKRAGFKVKRLKKPGLISKLVA